MSTASRDSRLPSQSGPVIFVLGLIAGLLFALCTEFILTRSKDADDLLLLAQVRDLALADYVTEVQSRDLIDNALGGMLEGLDGNSRFYPSQEVESVTRETTGEFRGIGVVFRQPVSAGQVLFPFPGSPSARAGLEVGDRLISVHDRLVRDFEEGELQSLLRSRGAGEIALLVEDLAGNEKHLRIRPEPVTDPTVRHLSMLDPELGLGYLAILSFTHGTALEFDRAMLELQAIGLKRLIIDLRSNPGGVLDAAVKIANRFIAEGTLVTRVTRHETVHSVADPSKAIFKDIALVVLVDGGSASASEVLAGALQDHCVATLVGVPTYGKGTVQTLQKLARNRGMLKFTTAKYYTPAQREIERVQGNRAASGIAPELIVQVPQDQRLALRRHAARYSPPLALLPLITAWEAAENLELIAPNPEDDQLAAAVALLSGLAPDAERQAALQ